MISPTQFNHASLDNAPRTAHLQAEASIEEKQPLLGGGVKSYVQTAKAFKLRDLFADARPASVISNPFNCGQPVFPCAKSGLAILDARPLPVLTGSARARVLRQPSIGVNEARGHTSCHGAQTLCLAPAPPAAPPRRERLDVRIGR